MCIRDRNENVKCWEKYCDERIKERETEIFKLNRDYEILIQNLCMEREEQIDLPYKIEFDNCFDEYDEKINYPILNIITNGDWTEIHNVDLVYDYYDKMNKLKFYGCYTQDSHMCVTEIENCYLKQRLIFDDGG